MPGGDKSSTGRRASTSGVLKEKIVQYYECILQGEDPSKNNHNFWNEFFLLRANVEALEQQFAVLKTSQITKIKENVNELFLKCVVAIEESHPIKTINAIQTMCGLVRGAFSKAQGSYGFEVIDLLIGFDGAEGVMQTLIENIHKILIKNSSPVSLRNVCLRFFLTLITVTDNISQNTVLEYLMMNNIFEALILIMSDPTLRQQHGSDAVILLMLLVQYRKYEATNPYVVNLSILDSDVALNGLSQIITLSLLAYNRQYAKKLQEEKATGFMSSITNMVGSIFTSDQLNTVTLRPDLSLLLGLYEAIHLNRNFISALTTSYATPMCPSSDGSAPQPSASPAVLGASQISLEDTADLEQPTNLLVAFLEYASIVTRDVKDAESFNIAKLCFIVMACVAEDQYANSLMHDANMTFRVPLHKMQMRHRKLPVELTPPPQPLASFAIDLQVEFLLSHLMKAMPAELMVLSIGILHRLLCYQKRCRVRLNYPWKQLWTALINLLKFILSNETNLLKMFNIFIIIHKIINIINLFITYGDNFLAQPNSYDELYYELIRMHQVFENIYSMALRHSSGSGEWKEDATKLLQNLGNIRAVVNHFNPKIESWAAVNHLSSLTEEQVLEVVKSNYDTLTLKIYDSLDQFERYSEKPKETNFFTTLVKSVVLEVRQKSAITKLEQASLLREVSLSP